MTNRSGAGIDIGSVDFESFYRGEGGFADIEFDRPPWDIGEPQPVLVQLERDGGITGRVLDAGCGPGDNAIYLAERGYSVTGVDGSATVLGTARERAAARGVRADFQVADATTMEGVPQEFDTVLDSALYHCLPAESRAAYGAALHRVTKPGAKLHVLCFADVEDAPAPATVSQDDLRTNLGEHWRINAIEQVRYSGAFDPETVARQFEQFMPGFDAGAAVTDDHGRFTFPMWHLQAERA